MIPSPNLSRVPLPTTGLDPAALPFPGPGWMAALDDQAPETLRFMAGAGLALLHPLALGRYTAVPLAVLIDRQALTAAAAVLRVMGRREDLRALRDALHLQRPGEALGPAGAVGLAWRQGVRTTLSGHCRGSDPSGPLDPAAGPDPAAGSDPVARAARALQAALEESGDPTRALLAAEAALAAALGWPRVLPVLTPGLTRADLAVTGAALTTVLDRAIATQAPKILQKARDLARRAERLRAVAPRLRSRGANAALAMFLTEDALAPTLALAPVVRGSAVRMSDRAARRLCERLVELGGLRELTGRASSRLYGL